MPAPPQQPAAVKLRLGENVLFPGFLLRAQISPIEESKKIRNIHRKFANVSLDYDKIKGEIFLRARQPGDRIALPGREFTSSLKKLIQANLPPERRAFAHVLADASGVIYAEGAGCAARVCPDADTRRLLVLEMTELT